MNRENPLNYLKGYIAEEKLPLEGIYGFRERVNNAQTKKINSECLSKFTQSLDKILEVTFAENFILVASFDWNTQPPKNYFQGEDVLSEKHLQNIYSATPKLIDMSDRLKSFPLLVQLPPFPITFREIYQLGDKFDMKDYDAFIEEAEERGFLKQVEELKKESKTLGERNSTLILDFLESKGLKKEILLPSFLEQMNPVNLKNADFDTIYKIVAKEVDKVRIAHHVLSKQKAFDTIVAKNYNTHIELAHAIHEKDIPFDMLGETALQILLGKIDMDLDGIRLIQANLDEIVNMSKDLRFILSNEATLEFIDLEKWVHIPTSPLTGIKYTVFAHFEVQKFKQYLEKTNWIKLASYRKFENTIQFYTPNPSPTFQLHFQTVQLSTDIEGIFSRLVDSDDPNLEEDVLSSNLNMIKELQHGFQTYFVMQKLSQLYQTDLQMNTFRLPEELPPPIDEDLELPPPIPDELPPPISDELLPPIEENNENNNNNKNKNNKNNNNKNNNEKKNIFNESNIPNAPDLPILENNNNHTEKQTQNSTAPLSSKDISSSAYSIRNIPANMFEKGKQSLRRVKDEIKREGRKTNTKDLMSILSTALDSKFKSITKPNLKESTDSNSNWDD